jgi:hypothetical protein
MTDRNALAQQIASILDYPSIYMGAPSNRSLRYAEKIVGLLDEHIAAARAEALEEAAAKCDDLQAFGDAHEGNGNSKAWARAAESLASQIRALVEQKL